MAESQSKMSKIDDLDKLTKCLRMLSSNADGEVLAAKAIVKIQNSKQIDLASEFDSFKVALIKQAETISIQKTSIFNLSETINLFKNKTLYERVFKWQHLGG